MRKPVFIETKVSQVGPRQIIDLMGSTINHLKYERSSIRYWQFGNVTPEPLMPGTALGLLIARMYHKEVDRLVYANLNPDYKTFTVTEMRRSKLA